MALVHSNPGFVIHAQCPWDFEIHEGRNLSIAETPFTDISLGGQVALTHSLLNTKNYSYRTRSLHEVSIFHNGNHATSVQNSGPMTVYFQSFLNHIISNYYKNVA